MHEQLWDSWEGHLQAVDNAFRPEELEALKSLLERIPTPWRLHATRPEGRWLEPARWRRLRLRSRQPKLSAIPWRDSRAVLVFLTSTSTDHLGRDSLRRAEDGSVPPFNG